MVSACEEIGSARTESRGTESANPVPSSGESAANRDRGNHREQHLGNATGLVFFLFDLLRLHGEDVSLRSADREQGPARRNRLAGGT